MLKMEKKRRHLMTSHVAVRPGYNQDITPQERHKIRARGMKGHNAYWPWKGRNLWFLADDV